MSNTFGDSIWLIICKWNSTFPFQNGSHKNLSSVTVRFINVLVTEIRCWGKTEVADSLSGEGTSGGMRILFRAFSFRPCIRIVVMDQTGKKTVLSTDNLSVFIATK